MTPRLHRLTMSDRSNLRIERRTTPVHIGGLCIVEGLGELDLAAVRRRIALRLPRVPDLRKVVYQPGFLGGPPLWVDDPSFAIEHHVNAVAVPAPGDERAVLDAAAELLKPLLDRSRPLWELWFLTGLQGGEAALLFKLHHAIADGLASVALISALFDLDPDAPDPPPAPWAPEAPPAAFALVRDNLETRLTRVAQTVGHPLRPVGGIAGGIADSVDFLGHWRAAPPNSLNAVPGAGRTLRVLRLDLEAARGVAHAHDAKINDVLLAIVASGLRDVLRSRGEPVDDVELTASIPVALRPASAAGIDLGNQVGGMLAHLPIGPMAPGARLERVAALTRAAKATQHPAYIQSVFAWMAASGLARWFSENQHMVNFFLTNVPGPAVPLYVLGGRIREVLPITGLQGNITVMFAALSYCGRLSLVVNADPARWTDIDLFMAAMAQTWCQLSESALAPVAALG